MINNPLCDLCGGQLSKPLMRWAFNSFPCRTAICLDCGLVKLNPRWSDKEYSDFYKNKYDLFFRGPDVPLFELFISDMKNKGTTVSKRLASINLPQKSRILDIGAGTGFTFFSILNSDGRDRAEFYAVETSQRCRKFLQSKGVKVVARDLSEQWGNGYDLVVCRHVLEHVMLPISFLTRIREVLTEDGYVYVAVPNIMRCVKAKVDTFFRHVHTFYFNIYTLIRCCEKAGLYPVKAGWEGENWAVLTTRKSGFVVPEISYQQQREVLDEALSCRQFKAKPFVGSIIKRFCYGC